jgi:cobalamin-dependent methionine synthase I
VVLNRRTKTGERLVEVANGQKRRQDDSKRTNGARCPCARALAHALVHGQRTSCRTPKRSVKIKTEGGRPLHVIEGP